MHYLNVRLAQLSAAPLANASSSSVGTWLRLCAHCYRNGSKGRIDGGALLNDRGLLAIGVTSDEMLEARQDGLVAIDGDDLIITPFNDEDIDKHLARKEANAVRNKAYRDRKKQERDASRASSRDAVTPRDAQYHEHNHNQEQEHTHPTGVGASEDLFSPGEVPATAETAHSRLIAEANEARLMPWFKKLQASGCKIGDKSWMAWQEMINERGLDVVLSAARKVPASERFSGRVLEELEDGRNNFASTAEGQHESLV